MNYARKLEIPYFRGVYMRNKLPSTGPYYQESAIVNLDNDTGPGTHWVCYKKGGNEVIYFNSFGNLQPPIELMEYLKVNTVKYNSNSYNR